MLNYKERNDQYLEFIEQYLNSQCFVDDRAPQQKLFSAMRYSLLAGGKRLRPIFVFDFCRMCGGDWQAAAPFAAAVEMIHTYSLIHDDLPCMDNDDYRRGRLTNHKVYGEAIAVLAGDALLTAAFSYLAAAPFSAQTRIRAVEILSHCAGELGMVGGQVLDMQSEERQCTEQEVLDIQSRKTGALIRAACMLGVLAGEGSDAQLAAASNFAEHLGLAFQIRDDILDVIGNSQELGKAVGVDQNKNTFVQLYGLDACNHLVHQHTEQALENLKEFENAEFMSMLAKKLIDRTV
ncbi:MAG: polyprenyl synthetase family protein [Oscillospiraceae bacterium]|nr:polyprenyl synthetase family protein [Oscillospiraceae bacterium]